MTDLKNTIEETINEIKQERDELKVKLHLAKLDVSDEWNELENKLAKLEDKSRAMGSATADASKDIGAAINLLGGEIRNGFKSIKNRF